LILLNCVQEDAKKYGLTELVQKALANLPACDENTSGSGDKLRDEEEDMTHSAPSARHKPIGSFNIQNQSKHHMDGDSKHSREQGVGDIRGAHRLPR
jgi:hypothetical protein